jgi:REP element-mobilizing transposase RayT
MSRRLRFIPDHGALVEVTCRALHSRFLFRPGPMLNAIILGALARAKSLYPVRICAFAFVSNHFHLTLEVDDAQQLARFMNHLNSKLAREVGRLTGWREKIFGRRYQAILISSEDQAQIERLKYVLSHGCKEGLVERLQEWPGVHCVQALMEGKPLEGRPTPGARRFAEGTTYHGDRFEMVMNTEGGGDSATRTVKARRLGACGLKPPETGALIAESLGKGVPRGARKLQIQERRAGNLLKKLSSNPSELAQLSRRRLSRSLHFRRAEKLFRFPFSILSLTATLNRAIAASFLPPHFLFLALTPQCLLDCPDERATWSVISGQFLPNKGHAERFRRLLRGNLPCELCVNNPNLASPLSAEEDRLTLAHPTSSGNIIRRNNSGTNNFQFILEVQI